MTPVSKTRVLLLQPSDPKEASVVDDQLQQSQSQQTILSVQLPDNNESTGNPREPTDRLWALAPVIFISTAPSTTSSTASSTPTTSAARARGCLRLQHHFSSIGVFNTSSRSSPTPSTSPASDWRSPATSTARADRRQHLQRTGVL